MYDLPRHNRAMNSYCLEWNLNDFSKQAFGNAVELSNLSPGKDRKNGIEYQNIVSWPPFFFIRSDQIRGVIGKVGV